MVAILPDGKEINISEKQKAEIMHLMTVLELSENEALSTWLCDNDYITDEEQEALDSKAKKVKIRHEAKAMSKDTKSNKPRTVKISDEKKELFQIVKNALIENYGESATKVEKENKLLILTTDSGKVFKIDLIEQRQKKQE